MAKIKKRSYTQMGRAEIARLKKLREMRMGTSNMVTVSGLSRLTLQRAWEGLLITTHTAEVIRTKILGHAPHTHNPASAGPDPTIGTSASLARTG